MTHSARFSSSKQGKDRVKIELTHTFLLHFSIFYYIKWESSWITRHYFSLDSSKERSRMSFTSQNWKLLGIQTWTLVLLIFKNTRSSFWEFKVVYFKNPVDEEERWLLKKVQRLLLLLHKCILHKVVFQRLHHLMNNPWELQVISHFFLKELKSK